MWLRRLTVGESRCKVCGETKPISTAIGLCVRCIREKPEDAVPIIREAHVRARKPYGLQPTPPRTEGGVRCTLCANECVMGEGERGFCGLRGNSSGKLDQMATSTTGVLHAYVDPHVTNCCSAWFCPAGTGAGHPEFAMRDGAETGYCNYAVFFYGCNFDCLFCQNASHKSFSRSNKVSIEEFVKPVIDDPSYTCVCYFGGSPEPQMPFALKASKRMLEEAVGRVLRVCFEWNGCGNPENVREAAELALRSGGNLKFDLKCFDETLSLAFSGVPNNRAYENFKMVAEEFYGQRPELPVLTATTLLVPHYVDRVEVERIAGYIAQLDPEIPYSLLVFHPDFAMRDLPVTPRGQVEECYRAAKKHLSKVNVGNIHLLA